MNNSASSVMPQVLKLSENDWKSLYIPYLDNTFARDDVIYMFEHKYFVGKVNRVDFVKARPKNNLSNKEWMSAFVHFDCWFDNDFTHFLREYLEKNEKYDMQRYLDFVPPTRRKFQPDHFHVLINQSDGNPSGVPIIQRKNKANEKGDIEYIMDKHERRISLLEEEVGILKELIYKRL